MLVQAELLEVIILLTISCQVALAGANGYQSNNVATSPPNSFMVQLELVRHEYLDEKIDTVTSYCHGSLISDEWLLTAAHCFRYINRTTEQEEIVTNVQVLLSSSLPTQSIRMAVRRAFLHPNFSPHSLHFDFALVRLQRRVSSPNYQPIQLPTLEQCQEQELISNSTIIGWVNRQPIQRNMKLVPFSVCSQYLPGTQFSESKQCAIAAVVGEQSIDANCVDYGLFSGSPLLAGRTLIGVASYGRHVDCSTSPSNPTVFAKICRVMPWVRSHLVTASKLIVQRSTTIRGRTRTATTTPKKRTTSVIMNTNNNIRECGELPQIENGQFQSGSSKDGAMRRIVCNRGYVVDGSTSITCRVATRQWSEPGTCIRRTWSLTGNQSDAAVEMCNFLCENGYMCIQKSHRCDGYNDCGDGSDELDCPKRNRTTVNGLPCDGTSHFTCDNGKVISCWQICDDNTNRRTECDDGSDESVCTPGIRRQAWLDRSLRESAANGSIDLVRSLLDRGANINTKIASGWTPLMEAADWARLSIVRLLVQRGADVNAINDDGGHVLHYAVYRGYASIVRVLVDEADAYLEVTKHGCCKCNGLTPLGCAVDRNYPELVRYLRSRGSLPSNCPPALQHSCNTFGEH